MPGSDAPPRAAIFGCAGLSLSDAERRFFAAADPLGFIVFKRNIADPEQLARLVADFRAVVGRADAPVLVDQEGGRVQRMGPPYWRKAPPAALFAALAARDPALAARATRLNHRLLAADLKAVGIDVDCAPVLDLPVAGAHDIIGDRAFGAGPAQVAALGRAACEGLLEGGVLPVIKHIPGHGRALADSHLALPEVATPLAELGASDFAPFLALADMPWAMTAHVLYTALDAQRPATLSPVVVREVIRGAIGFDGLLLTDDLSMRALSGDFGERTRLAMAAGCDVALHCNGDMDEMIAIAAATPHLSDAALTRLARGRAMLAGEAPFDTAAALGTLTTWLEPVA